MNKLNMSIFEDAITDDENFEAGLNGEKQLTIKWGADPSAPDLHLGHFVILNQLSILQNLGHKIIFIIGDFTARIGDPTGKSSTRKPLTQEEIKKNSDTYLSQVFKVLDQAKTKVVYNSTWLDQLNSTDIINLTSKYTVARMLERDDFSKRFKGNISISIHEFLYPLLQGYDSVHLKCDVEIGGTDQKFNFLVGRHLQKEAGLAPQSILTLPILEGLDGIQKMSKSLNNYIAIFDSPKDMFGKCMSIPDDLIFRYFLLLTRLSSSDLETIKVRLSSGENPRNIKMELALIIVEIFYSKRDAKNEKEAFINVFSKKQNPLDIPEVTIENKKQLNLVEFMLNQNLVSSKKEARRLIEQGAVSINEHKISDSRHNFVAEDNLVVKVGKLKFLKIRNK